MLSFKKLENLLSEKGYIIREIFSMGDVCVYISIVSMHTSEFFLVYIPSKYTIKIENRYKIYKIKEIDVNYLRTKSEVECADERDDLQMELSYNEIEAKYSLDKNDENKLSDHLDEKYNRPILMKNSDKANEIEIKDIYRQINRLKYCVSSIKIKIAVGYKNYLAVIKRDNTSVCYVIKNYTVLDNMRRLLAVVDLENFYQKTINIQDEIIFVRNGIHRVLNKNQIENITLISKLLSGKSDFEKFLASIRTKMDNFQTYLIKFNRILNVSNEKEGVVVKKLRELKNRGQTVGIQGVHLDIQTLHQISASESELRNVLEVKQETMKHIEMINTHHNDFLLFIDKILYDNAIMTDSILRNFDLAKNYMN
jgi:hypothetical protein